MVDAELKQTDKGVSVEVDGKEVVHLATRDDGRLLVRITDLGRALYLGRGEYRLEDFAAPPAKALPVEAGEKGRESGQVWTTVPVGDLDEKGIKREREKLYTRGRRAGLKLSVRLKEGHLIATVK